MKRILIKSIATAVLITVIKGSALLSQEVVPFKTITEALECVYTNQHEVRKLIIEGEIAGSDYISEDSEWKYFRTLDEVFINLEEVEIWTSQPIPDVDVVYKDNGYTDKSTVWIILCLRR